MASTVTLLSKAVASASLSVQGNRRTIDWMQERHILDMSSTSLISSEVYTSSCSQMSRENIHLKAYLNHHKNETKFITKDSSHPKLWALQLRWKTHPWPHEWALNPSLPSYMLQRPVPSRWLAANPRAVIQNFGPVSESSSPLFPPIRVLHSLRHLTI